MNLRQAADALLAALLAPPCAVCGRVIERPLDGAVCDACWAAIPPHTSQFFLQNISLAQALGPYEATLRDVLHALKYDRRRSIAPRLSTMMAAHGERVLVGADVVVPVPLHRRRLRQRGFNQADDLARGLGLPVAPVLRRIRATAPQVDLPADQRRENVRDAFAIRRAIDFCGLRSSAGPFDARPVVVLVDDVATTGATLEACARVLKAGGAAEVRALTAARAVPARRQARRG
jgi:ComF family protein